MWPFKKQYPKYPRVVELQNGKFAVQMSSDRFLDKGRTHSWRTRENIAQCCLCETEEEAKELLQTVHVDVKRACT